MSEIIAFPGAQEGDSPISDAELIAIANELDFDLALRIGHNTFRIAFERRHDSTLEKANRACLVIARACAGRCLLLSND